MTRIAPYGTWESPITAEIAAAVGGGPQWVRLVDGQVWWAEARPHEDGRVAIVTTGADGEQVEVLPPGWNARNRVHEYGGMPFAVTGGACVFTRWDDQRLWRVAPGGEPVPLTPEPQRRHGLRYADPTVTPDGSAVWCVRETITGDLPTDVRRELVAVPLDGGAADDPDAVAVLAASHHFLTSPRPSPDGTRAAWIGWDHPAMPWDSTELCVADVTPDGFDKHRVLAGGAGEAVCQAEWDGDDALFVMTDPDGWWNLRRVGLDGADVNLTPFAEELGGAMWKLGTRWFAPLGDGRCAVLRHGLSIVSADGVERVETEFDWLSGVAGEHGRIAALAGGSRRDVVVVTSHGGPDARDMRVTAVSAPRPDLPHADLLPRAVELRFAAADGAEVPAYVYPPTNPGFAAPDGERPPFVVHVHGGPTGRSSPMLDVEIAFFTSRGIGVVAPNYGGSTGYGRAWRERLREQWGVIDVTDCAAVALALAADGVADGERLAIRGGSAGGWTVAASLTSADAMPYRCGVAMFPIIDLTRWIADDELNGGTAALETHDFESQYLTSLVGALPEHKDRYADRSPSTHADRIAGPILLLQGLEDEICPPAQAERLLAGLTGSGVPHAYLAFEGEQHGFRRAANVVAALNAELSFYGQVLGFDPPGTPRLELSS